MDQLVLNNELIKEMVQFAIILEQQRFSMSQEKQTQAEIEEFLKSKGFYYEREKRLSAQDVPDFILNTGDGNILLEVKTRCSRRAVYRQLERYAQHNNVNGLVLLTATSMKLPNQINGKPAIVVSIGAGWL